MKNNTMKKMLALIALLCLISLNSLYSQKWIQLIGTAEYQEMSLGTVETSDGGFLSLIITDTTSSSLNFGLSDITQLVKLNANGQELWRKSFPTLFYNPLSGRRLIASGDGSFILIGRDATTSECRRVNILKVDEEANILWAKSTPPVEDYPGLPPNILQHVGSVITTTDGGYALTARSSPSQVFSDNLLYKLDADGNTLWQVIPGKVFLEPSVTVLTQLQDGGFIMASSGQVHEDFYRMDNIGNVIWDTSLPGSNFSANAILTANNGNVYLAHWWDKIIEYDLNGNIVRDVLDLGSISINFNDLKKTSDQGYIATGSQLFHNPPSPTEYDIGLHKINNAGNPSWSLRIRYPDFQFSTDVLETSDNHFLISGYSETANERRQAILIKTDSVGFDPFNLLEGHVFRDDNGDCLFDTGEEEVTQWLIEARRTLPFSSSYFTTSDENGHFQMAVDSGTYTVELHANSPYWEICPPATVSFPDFYDSLSVDLGLDSQIDCPYLTIDIASTRLRPCTNTTYSVRYCNEGTIAADNAYIEISLDPHLTYVSSNPPLSSQNGNVLTFDLGTLPINQCGSILIGAMLDCDSPLGITHCTEAHIYPDSLCIGSLNWSGASIELSGACEEEEIVNFTLKNVGSGNMTGQQDYIVIIDDVILKEGSYQLAAGDSMLISEMPQGATIRMEAMQEPNHPGNSQPSIVIEGCGEMPFSMGFVSQFPQNDADPFLDIDCKANIFSYDPNDKTGFPTGTQEAHYIKANQDIEYLIRFQNTGTDTAYQVVIRDTISKNLDITKIRVGAASHPYTYTISGTGVLVFSFDNIYLPDSTTNKSASQGFVKFRIPQVRDLAVGSLILNSAAILFDFNDPVITNETVHTIGEDFLPVAIEEISSATGLDIQVYPNPTKANIHFVWTEEKLEEAIEFRLYHIDGRLLHQQLLKQSPAKLDMTSFAAGIYMYTLHSGQGRLAEGKLIYH